MILPLLTAGFLSLLFSLPHSFATSAPSTAQTFKVPGRLYKLNDAPVLLLMRPRLSEGFFLHVCLWSTYSSLSSHGTLFMNLFLLLSLTSAGFTFSYLVLSRFAGALKHFIALTYFTFVISAGLQIPRPYEWSLPSAFHSVM